VADPSPGVKSGKKYGKRSNIVAINAAKENKSSKICMHSSFKNFHKLPFKLIV